MGKSIYPITIYLSKSSAAKRLNIDRKTIQRKVKAEKLSQDGKGRIRWDELVAELKADEIRGRRGPKVRIPNVESAQKTYRFDQKRGLVECPLDSNGATLWNEKLDEQAVEDIKRQLANLGSASLDAIAKEALALSHHKKRLAKVGLVKPGSEILAALATPSALPLQSDKRGKLGR